ncbi:MAG: TaqI-like C-terminal specificity domain-containing protein [Bacteroidota bacterium]
MPLFQQSVATKYLKSLDKQIISSAYTSFKAHFHNPTIQENIRNRKEEQYQEGFLNDLFVNVLGYTKSPTPNFNLTTEYKNVKDSKKADGAILVGEAVKAVIELKGTNTTDLGKIEEQAFGYKNNQPECVYVITSNFEKLRFYIDNAIEHIEFNLFTLSASDFELLYICLAYESIRNGIPKKIKDESVSQEDKVTKLLYKDYSQFKQVLYQDLVAKNPQFDALVLFKKSQKLLDRFLFLFFAEDRHLLPPNSVRMILNQWQQLRDLDEYTPLYGRFMKYFGYLNTGFKGKQYDVFAYNGGLFKPDDVLDNVVIDDDLLYTHTLKLSDYDFDSEVDVNILGHIFENSLNELDEVKSQIEGLEIDKTKTKRKKDGVFYTPKYITKYIVDSTVGKLCTEKKAELHIVEDDFTTDKKRQLKTKQVLLERLTAYRDWLLQITICDPACGSGAFLNQALDFLISEHHYIDELQAKLTGATLVMSDIENSILENNLFGVDINEESVEIAKLSLWLRTAQPNRKLNDLNHNIKCGNSLIDDPAVAGDKAFDWAKEFPQVFGREASTESAIVIQKEEKPDFLKLIKEKTLEAQAKSEQALSLSQQAIELSKKAYEYAEKLEAFQEPSAKYGNKGFDVVIGNPPYGAKIRKEELDFIIKEYNHFGIGANLSDTYFSFYAMSLTKLVANNGCLGFITPNTWKLIESAKQFRKVILNRPYNLVQINQHLEKVFADATVDCDTLIIHKTNNLAPTAITISNQEDIVKQHFIEQSILANQDSLNLFMSTKEYELKDKINANSTTIAESFVIKNGVKPYEKGKGKPAQTDKIMQEKPFTSEIKIDESFSPLIGGSYFHKYKLIWDKDYWIQYGEWLAAPRDKDIFEAEEKLIFRQTADSIVGNYITRGFIIRDNTHILLNKYESKYNLKYVLVLLNSKLTNWYYWTINPERGEAMAQVKAFHLGMLPFKATTDQQPFITKADQMLSLNKELQDVSGKFQRNLIREFSLAALTTKLQNWYKLDYVEFIKELEKQKVKLSLHQKAEWETYFDQEVDKACTLKSQIDTTDREIDAMVYALYGLTEEEIRIVEG